MTSRPPLEGLRVLELASGDAASAYTARLLAQMGAEVTCIEPPEGSYLRRLGPFPDGIPNREKSAAFFAFNFNKKGITLNLRTATGRDCFERMLANVDVLVFGNDLLADEQLGLSAARLTEAFPALVAACVSPFGAEGPWATWKGSDLQVAAVGGVAVGTGRKERPLAVPMGVGVTAGGLSAAAGVLAALLGREQDGLGDWVDAAAADVWATIHCNYIATYLYQGVAGIRSGNRGGGRYPLAVFRCKDGQVFIDCLQLPQWIRFVEMMGSPEWSTNPRYRDRRAMMTEYPDEVDALVTPWLEQYTREELWEMARSWRVPLAPLYDLDEVLSHPHLAHREFFLNVPWEGQALSLPGLPFDHANDWVPVTKPSPRLGEHNVEVLQGELKFEREDLVQMKAAGII